MAIELTKDEVLHTLLAINTFAVTDDGFTCEVCNSATKKLEAEFRKLYDLPPETTLLQIPEAYKALGVVQWERQVGGHHDE